MSHIAVERNRRRQMNEHLKVLRSMTPCFYIKRVGFYHGIVCPSLCQLALAYKSVFLKPETASPRVRQDPSNSQVLASYGSETNTIAIIRRSTGDQASIIGELGASCNSPVADVEAKISGSNVILRTVSRRIPGQVVKIVSLLEKLSLEILHLNISSMEDTVLYSFVIKIGLECPLSVEELAVEVQKSFSLNLT
ncbi:hypothetical protein CTI12_AA405620 [Artemisia annua]|uniref:BHLH domain-containing protein n=1 Tax=Artemisia annua TaxID=35608 RepID=A0A2U1M8W0_ARTAN|nr:hypothetical protein CTI12_AA405620 [Artemisia annua]